MPDLLFKDNVTASICEPGVVTSLDLNNRSAIVRIPGSPQPRKQMARYALPGPMKLTPGNEVLLTGDPDNQLYIIGVLSTPADTTTLTTPSGASASISPPEEGEKIQVRQASGELVFEYTPETGRCHLLTGSEHLDICAQNISFNAADSMQLGARQFDLIARKAELQGEEIKVTGQSLSGHVGKSRWVVDTLESISRTLITKTRNAYRTVEQLCQLKAGRSRTVIKGTHTMNCERSLQKADKDYKIDGERIHLG